jgi:hypothetical protein
VVAMRLHSPSGRGREVGLGSIALAADWVQLNTFEMKRMAGKGRSLLAGDGRRRRRRRRKKERKKEEMKQRPSFALGCVALRCVAGDEKCKWLREGGLSLYGCRGGVQGRLRWLNAVLKRGRIL